MIARGLSAFDPDAAALAAGRVMLTRLHELAAQRTNFAFETTLASRTFAPWRRDLKASGYAIHFFFLWLPSADLAVERVADRVRAGGHNVPEETVRRRYGKGLRNFTRLYESLASTWRLYDGSGAEPRLVAERLELQPLRVYDEAIWDLVRRQDSI